MGRKITIYLIDGTATGPKTVDIGNWSGAAIYSPRANLKTVLARPEFANPGVYFLKSEAQSAEFSESIYIGEAEELRARLQQHIAGRDFESVTCFLSKDDMLTKAHIKYLESRLIAIARSAKTAKVENSSSPRVPHLSEADVSDMEYFVEQIELVLPTVGLYALIPSIQTGLPTIKAVKPSSKFREFRIVSSSVNARMVESDEGFVVLKGSEASMPLSRSIADGWIKLRNKLQAAGKLEEDNGKFVFTDDTSFSSPSAAASVILGRQAAGPISWVDEEGRTYKQVQELAVRESAQNETSDEIIPRDPALVL